MINNLLSLTVEIIINNHKILITLNLHTRVLKHSRVYKQNRCCTS